VVILTRQTQQPYEPRRVDAAAVLGRSENVPKTPGNDGKMLEGSLWQELSKDHDSSCS